MSDEQQDQQDESTEEQHVAPAQDATVGSDAVAALVDLFVALNERVDATACAREAGAAAAAFAALGAPWKLQVVSPAIFINHELAVVVPLQHPHKLGRRVDAQHLLRYERVRKLGNGAFGEAWGTVVYVAAVTLLVLLLTMAQTVGSRVRARRMHTKRETRKCREKQQEEEEEATKREGEVEAEAEAGGSLEKHQQQPQGQGGSWGRCCCCCPFLVSCWGAQQARAARRRVAKRAGQGQREEVRHRRSQVLSVLTVQAYALVVAFAWEEAFSSWVEHVARLDKVKCMA